MKQRHFAFLLILLIALFATAQNPSAPDPYKPILDRLNAVSMLPLADWRAHPGNLPHGEDVALTETGWSPLKVADNWTDSSQWVRTTITVPEKLNGYDLRGARIDLDLAITSDNAIQINLFNNGSLIARTDEDTQLPVTLTTNAQPGQKFVIAARITGSPIKTSVRRAQLLIQAAANRPDPGMLRTEILAARPMVAAYADGKEARQQHLDSAVNAIDLTTLDRADQAAFDA